MEMLCRLKPAMPNDARGRRVLDLRPDIRMPMRFLPLLTFLSLAFVPLGAAEHHGVVKFGGLPVPGASVTVTQGHQRLTAISNQQGAYSFPDLADGLWTIQVEMLCFAPFKREVWVASSGPGVEWELKVLPLAEIAADRHVAAPLSTTAAAGRTASGDRPSKPDKNKKPGPSPANTSTPFQRADPSAFADAGKITSDPESQVQELLDKATDSLLINGSVNNGANSTYAQLPAFGNFRNTGGGRYRGSLSIAEGNSALDAKPFSLTGQDTAKPDYNQLTLSASVGGPLWIPHLWSANKAAYAFLNYEWTRNSNATVANGLMPEPTQRNGDFSQSATTVIDPATGAPFPSNRIPASRISTQASHLLALYPLPAFVSSGGYNYQVPLLGAAHRDVFRSKVSKAIGRSNFFFGDFSLDSTRSDNPSMFAFLDTSWIRSIKGTVRWNRTFGGRLFSTLEVPVSRTSSRTTPFFANRRNISGEAGIAGNDQKPVNWGPPTLSFTSGITPLSDGQYSVTRAQATGLSYSINWGRGSHNLKFGAGYSRTQLNSLSQQNPRGSFLFTGAATGSDVAGFLLGIPDTSSIAFGNADKYFRSNTYHTFFNDDWRVCSGFSLNIGFRWEFASPISERYGRLVNLDIAPGFTAVAPVVATDPVGSLTQTHYPESLIRPDMRLVQPRFGFAWRPIAGDSLVIRGGYGIYADSSVYQSIATQMAQQAPISRSLSVQNTPATPLTMASGFDASARISQATFAVDPAFRMAYAQNWQLSIQHNLPASLVTTIEYLGIKGTHLRRALYPNTYPTGASTPCPLCPAGFEYLESGGNSTRQAAQFRLRRRLRSGLTAGLQYTFAKALDNATIGGESSSGTLLVAQNWLDLAAERALSSFDQRHQLAVQFQYSTGVGVHGGTLLDGWHGGLFKDWTFITQLTAGSDLPLTPVYPVVVNGTGFSGSIRPDYTGAPLYAAHPGLVLNPAAYAPPRSGYWGNAGRNSIRGPSQFSLNASLQRTFRLTDRLSLDLHLDSANLLNHVTYRSWNTVITSMQFGRPDVANSMRTVRTNLQVRF